MGHGVRAAEAEVNVETGPGRVRQFASAIDVGKAMNPQGGEMHNFGGACMGIGIVLHNESIAPSDAFGITVTNARESVQISRGGGQIDTKKRSKPKSESGTVRGG